MIGRYRVSRKEGVSVFIMPDRMDGEPGWWYAAADFDGSPAYDGSGRSPLEAAMRLAEAVAEALYKKQEVQGE